MEDRITVFDKKPFKGITTIQLFDKKTGEIVKEVVHENTYNQRLQYSMYLDEIMSARSNDNVPTSWSLYSYWGQSTRQLGISHRSYSYDAWSVTHFGSEGTGSASFNLFGTLFLTNHTSAASASGQADGIPVAIAPLSGAASDATVQMSCGTLNIQESYIHDDRVHFVIDFDTAHGNGTFDSLWIFPSTKYISVTSLDPINQCDSMTPFYDFAEIKRERLETSVAYSGNSCKFLHINKPYLVIADYINDPRDSSSIYKYHVYNTQTNQVVASYDFGTSGKSLPYTPLYYDALENILYGVYFYTWNGIWNNNYSWVQDAAGDMANMRPVTINLTTGIVTVNSSTNLVANANITFEDLGIHTSGNSQTTLFYAENGNYYFVTSHKGLDEDNIARTVISIILYNPKTFAITPIRHIMCSGSDYTLSSAIVRHNLLYLPIYTTDLSTTAVPQTGLVINLATGSILESKWCNYRNTPYNTFRKTVNSLHISIDGPRNRNNGSYLQSDIALYLPYSVRGSADSTNKVVLFERSTWIRALWTTHNHLEEAVTKTNQTTMKIQYDIVWDSITETIIPALL